MQNPICGGEGERRVFWCAVLLAGWWMAVIAPSAEAYIDPSAGGMLVQLLLAGTAGVAVLGKLFWSRIKGMFGGPDAKSSSKPAQSDSDSHDRV
jgi:hypothetical protein